MLCLSSSVLQAGVPSFERCGESLHVSAMIMCFIESEKHMAERQDCKGKDGHVARH